MTINEGNRRLLIGSIILLILGLQFIATFGTLAGLKAKKRFWPWTDYPMYQQRFVEGDRINVSGSIFVVLDNGERLPISVEDLGLGFWKHSYLFNRLSLDQAPEPGDISLVLSALPENAGDVRFIETYNYPLVIRREGPVEAEAELIRSIEID